MTKEKVKGKINAAVKIKEKSTRNEALLKQINKIRFALAEKRNKSMSLRQVSKETGLPHSTFFDVIYGKSKGGAAKVKITNWLEATGNELLMERSRAVDNSVDEDFELAI